LRRAGRRRQPVAFWHLGVETLAGAVLAAGDDEPLLIACAGVRASAIAWSGPFAPGLLEASGALGAAARLHAAALDGKYLDCEGVDAVEIALESESIRVARTAIDRAVASFRAAELRLVALTTEPAARASLVRFLGEARTLSGNGKSLAGDPLAAVSVAPDCEAQAATMGELLSVPIGMALSAFGMVEGV
jgi:hypothetical protein